MNNGKLFKVRDVAAYLGVARITVYRLAEKGKIPACKVGGQWRFIKREIDYWLRRKRH
jgi:excisionase family DNA binding protein